MDESRRKTVIKVFIVLGTSIMSLTQGLMLYWGNLTVYVHSYLKFSVGSSSPSQAPWVVPIYVTSRTVALLMDVPLQRLLGSRRWKPLFGILMSSVGMFLSYFSVQMSMFWLVITLAVVFGLGTGVLNAWTLELIGKHADDDVSFLYSFVLLAFGVGSVITNEFITRYVNPENLEPDLELRGPVLYFTQKQILDKVPSVFLILGICTVACNIIGFCFVISAQHFIQFRKEDIVQKEEEESSNMAGDGSNYGTLSNHEEKEIKDSESSSDEDVSARSALISIPSDNSLHEKMESYEMELSGENSEPHKDYSPKEVLQTGIFYGLAVAFVLCELVYIVMQNFYKIFGQLWISDDHFLTTLGTVMITTGTIAKPFWGKAFDTYGVKAMLVPLVSLMSISLVWCYFTPMVDKWLYFIVIVLVSNLGVGFYNSYVGVAAFIFGRKHLVTNFGLLRSATLIVNVAAPYLFETLVDDLGWFYTFLIIAAACYFSLILIIRFLPNK